MNTSKRGGEANRIRELDWQDLLVGAAVAAVILLGPSLGETMHTLAQGIVVAQLFFEMPMALLAVVAGKAAQASARAARIALLSFGCVVVVAAGVAYALQFGVLLALLPGIFAVLSRMRRAGPAQERFSVEHCVSVERVAVTAWVWLLAMFLVTVGVVMISGKPITVGGAAGSAANWIAAALWLVYYAGLAFLVPAARRGPLRWLDIDLTRLRPKSERRTRTRHRDRTTRRAPGRRQAP